MLSPESKVCAVDCRRDVEEFSFIRYSKVENEGVL